MTSETGPTRATSVTRDQNVNQDENQNQMQVRTRSRLALPEFNVNYDRSPLKNAREALRRANARFGQTSRSQDTDVNDAAGSKGNTKTNDILARASTNATSNPFRLSTVENLDRERKGVEPVETNGVMTQRKEDSEGSSSTLRPPSDTFDFSEDANVECPRRPKRARSASFDENDPPSPAGSDRQSGGITMTQTSPPIPSSPRLTVESNPTNNPDAQTSMSPTVSDSTLTTNVTSNPKRAKLGTQGTLDSFFTRSSPRPTFSSFSIQPKNRNEVPLRPEVTPSRRIFSEGSPTPSSQSDSSSTPRDNKPMVEEEATAYPKTPTMKHLRELPLLDLRTVAPSPRKRAVQLGLGTPGPKPALKNRAVSAGAALTLGHSEMDKGNSEALTSTVAAEAKQSINESHEEQMVHDYTPQAPPSPPFSPKVQSENHFMDIDSGSRLVDNDGTEAASKTDNGPPTITVSTSTSTLVCSSPSTTEDTIQRNCPPIPPVQAETQAAAPLPTTPRHKILPSRPLLSGHLPSTKGPMSKFLSMSPLTPLSALVPPRQDSDEYDFEEEERSIQDENKRAKTREAAKLAMQEEAEVEGASTSASAKQIAAFSCKARSSQKPESASPGVARKTGLKGKHKGKALSSTSRLAIGAAGVKKRKSLVSATSVTPRMRLTRASVLRQKAIQAQMRTPKDGQRMSFISSTKNAGSIANGDVRDNDSAREGSGAEGSGKSDHKKRSQTEPQKSPRKSFMLTVPSSLSPRKSSSASSSVNSSLTLKSNPLDSGSSKPFTFSLYPPSLSDAAATEQAQTALSKLSSALDKLAMPPPSKPNTSDSAQLRRPASEQRVRIRPATSLGFTRDMSIPISGTSGGQTGRPRATIRAGSAEPTKRSFFPPPPPPAFGSSLIKDKGKSKAAINSSRTAPVASGANGSYTVGVGQMRPPSRFRFGLGSGGSSNGIFGRPIPRMRASQKTSLETVRGSPVKGGSERVFAEDDEDEIIAADGNGQGDNDADADASASSSNAYGDTSISSVEGSDTPNGTNKDTGTSASGKELKRISKLNASRRASMAFSTLAQSLGTSPDTFSPFAPKDGTVDDKTPTEASIVGHKRSASATFSSSSSRPVRAAAPRSFVFGAPGLGRTQSESAVGANARARSVTPSEASESDTDGTAKSSSKKSGGGSMGRTKMPGSLDVLDQCIVFVDVRTEEGEDAGALFVDMLRGLGAKVLTRVSQTCTHIVYKNGLANTLTRYRLLDEPRPKVVGIGWVVECAEKRDRVNESRFQVDIENTNVAGALKRRRSFLPKQISNSSYTAGPMDAFVHGTTSGTEMPPAARPIPKACADSDVTSEDGDTSQDRAVLSGGSLSSEIHPLERARRRGAMIPR